MNRRKALARIPLLTSALFLALLCGCGRETGGRPRLPTRYNLRRLNPFRNLHLPGLKKLGRGSSPPPKPTMRIGGEEMAVSADPSSWSKTIEQFRPEPPPPYVPITLEGGRKAIPEVAHFTPEEEARAGRFVTLLLGKETYDNRVRALTGLGRAPDPEAEPALGLVIQTLVDPIAHLAADPLAKINTGSALATLEKALEDPRSSVRASVLQALASQKAPGASAWAVRALTKNDTSDVQMMAAYCLGLLREPEGREALENAIATSYPPVRLYAAWALWRIGDNRGGVFLARLALSEDLTLSPKAILFLNGMDPAGSIDVFLRALDSRHEGIWKSAYLALLDAREETLAGRLIPPGPLQEDTPVNVARHWRRIALLAVTRNPPLLEDATSPYWSLLLDLGSRGSPSEQELMTVVLATVGSLYGMEPLLRALEAAKPAARPLMVSALRSLAEKHRLSDPPQGGDETAWRTWWINHARASALPDSRAQGQLAVTVQGPDGLHYLARQGEMLAPGVFVVYTDAQEGRVHIGLLHHGTSYHLTGSGVVPQGMSGFDFDGRRDRSVVR
ncbi:MAG: HEAT repeat domain-containing protein [Planctomycetota bacterium]